MKRLIPFLLLLLLFCSACSPEAGSQPAAKKASAAPPEKYPPPSANSLAYLRQFVGKYPGDQQIIESEPFNSRLRALLGDKHRSLMINLQAASPFGEEDGILFITGNKPNSGATDAVAIVIDPKQDAMFVWLMVRGQIEAFREKNVQIALPKDVNLMISNAKPN